MNATAELRIDGIVVERSENIVDLLWKARRAAEGTSVFAEVEGPHLSAFFTDAVLHPWERPPFPRPRATEMTDAQFNSEVEALELRYMRGWIGLRDFRAAMVELYDRADREECHSAPAALAAKAEEATR